MSTLTKSIRDIKKNTPYAIFVLFCMSLLIGGCNVDPELARAVLVKAYIDELVMEYAPIHYQDVDPDGTWSLEGRSDYLTSINYDGDWDTSNNWEHIAPRKGHKAIGHAYYSVVLTETHAFIIYAFYHPRDWNSAGVKPDAHENDMEGVLEIIELPGRIGSAGFDYLDKGVLKAMVTVFHLDFYSYRNRDIPNAEEYQGNHEDIDGKIEFKEYIGGGALHPVTAQQSEGHGLKAWPHVEIKGGDGLIYYPAWEKHTEPGHPNDRSNMYRLIDIHKENGLWARRNNSETFDSFGVFNGNNHQWHTAHAPWGWDDKNDNPGRGDIAMDPIKLVKSYFKNLGNFSNTYILNQYEGIDFIYP